MHYGIMPDGNIIPDGSTVFLISTMNAGSVLYVYLIADFDKVHIPPYHSIEPKAAVITGYYIAYDGGIRSNEIIVTELGVFVFYRQYYRHDKFVIYFSS